MIGGSIVAVGFTQYGRSDRDVAIAILRLRHGAARSGQKHQPRTRSLAP